MRFWIALVNMVYRMTEDFPTPFIEHCINTLKAQLDAQQSMIQEMLKNLENQRLLSHDQNKLMVFLVNSFLSDEQKVEFNTLWENQEKERSDQNKLKLANYENEYLS